MFELYDNVIIKSNGIIGTIVDISETNGKKRYVVENNDEGHVEGTDGGNWALFDCYDNDIMLSDVRKVEKLKE